MTNYCICGHLPAEHEADRGRCSGNCFDSDYGYFVCLCHIYEKDTDD